MIPEKTPNIVDVVFSLTKIVTGVVSRQMRGHDSVGLQCHPFTGLIVLCDTHGTQLRRICISSSPKVQYSRVRLYFFVRVAELLFGQSRLTFIHDLAYFYETLFGQARYPF